AAAARAAARESIGELVRAARPAGVRVGHCTAQPRGVRLGANVNARLFAAMQRSRVGMLPGTPAVEVVPEVGVEQGDLVLTRHHGLSPMAGTELDPMLRNLGVRTFVATGGLVHAAIESLVV